MEDNSRLGVDTFQSKYGSPWYGSHLRDSII